MVRKIFLSCVFCTLHFLAFSSVVVRSSNDPKTCPYGDSECIKQLINFIFEAKVDGYPPLNIVSLNPLRVKEIVIKQDKTNPVFIDLRFQNCELYGIKGAKITHISGFGKEPAQSHELTLVSKAISMLSDYTIKGNVLVLPISGSGKSNITMENIKLSITLIGEKLIKNGKTHMHVKKLKLDIDTSRLYFDFKNLFNGDKVLSDNTNLFLNENWKDILDEVKTPISNAFGAVYKKVINNIFDKYPYDKLFTEM